MSAPKPANVLKTFFPQPSKTGGVSLLRVFAMNLAKERAQSSFAHNSSMFSFFPSPSVRQGSRMSILATTLSYSWYFPRVPFPYQHYSGSFLLFLSTYVEVTCSLLEGSTSSRACYSLLPRDFCGTPYI